jgi:hypothetical protein
MSDKSHVSMEQHVCIVCGEQFDTGALLLDKRMRNSLESHTVTGMGLCPEHQKLHDDGFIALVECDESKSVVRNDKLDFKSAHRTGNVLHMKRDAAAQILSAPDLSIPMMFVQIGVIEKIQSMVEKDD